mmetsp:Transcript_23490/g.73705  ORF Transcript_23490/g.73705 Transcript_23490/m.73705 type:complete len:210 (+) Transcript_23490:651-1280(+)
MPPCRPRCTRFTLQSRSPALAKFSSLFGTGRGSRMTRTPPLGCLWPRPRSCARGGRHRSGSWPARSHRCPTTGTSRGRWASNWRKPYVRWPSSSEDTYLARTLRSATGSSLWRSTTPTTPSLSLSWRRSHSWRWTGLLLGRTSWPALARRSALWPGGSSSPGPASPWPCMRARPTRSGRAACKRGAHDSRTLAAGLGPSRFGPRSRSPT